MTIAIPEINGALISTLVTLVEWWQIETSCAAGAPLRMKTEAGFRVMVMQERIVMRVSHQS
jgi:hypothetical protein